MPKTEIDKKVGRVLQGGKEDVWFFFPLGLRKTKEYKRCLLWYIICNLWVTVANIRPATITILYLSDNLNKKNQST